MIWGEDEVAAGGEGGEVGNVGAGDAEGLVAKDVLAGEEALADDLDVGGSGCGDDDERDGVVGEEGFDGGVGGDAGVLLLGVAAAALDDGGEFEAGTAVRMAAWKTRPASP